MQHIRRIAGRKGQVTKLINNIRDAMHNNEDEGDVRKLQRKLEDCRDVLVDEIFHYIEDLKDEDKSEVTAKKEEEIEAFDRKIEEVNNEIKDYFKASKSKVMHSDVDINEPILQL